MTAFINSGLNKSYLAQIHFQILSKVSHFCPEIRTFQKSYLFCGLALSLSTLVSVGDGSGRVPWWKASAESEKEKRPASSVTSLVHPEFLNVNWRLCCLTFSFSRASLNIWHHTHTCLRTFSVPAPRQCFDHLQSAGLSSEGDASPR